MANSAYDLYLGDKATLQGYRCRSLIRDSAPLVAARFSTGSPGETDLDLLKSASLNSLAGGMFQRDWEDSEKVARAIGVFNRYDKNVYPAPPRSSATSVSGGYYPIAKAESDSIGFIAYGAFSAGTYYNLLYKMTYGGGYASVTLPAALQNNGFCNITGMILHKNFLFVCSQTASSGIVDVQRYDIDAGTWQDVGGYAVLPFVLRDNLYVIEKGSGIYSYTNETIAGTANNTFICRAGSNSVTSIAQSAQEYNGAVYIAKPDGIFRFDGVTAVKVLNLVTSQMQVFNGRLYFISGFWLYSFDGTNVVRLQFFGNQEYAGSPYWGNSLALSANSDYLFITTVVTTSGYSSGDKVPATAGGLKRIYTYDGAAFMLLHENAETLGTGYQPTLVVIRNKLYDIWGNIVSGSWATNYYTFDFASWFLASAVTSSSKLEFTTSEFDDGFPNIYKSLELIEANYTGLVSGDSLVVSYQYYDGATWSSWITAGTITSTTTNILEITDFSKKLFKRLKINLTLTLASGSTAALKGCSFRYTLQPRMRWRWQANIMAEGNSTTKDRTDTLITGDANAFTNSVLKAAKQKTPIFMLAPDYGIVKTQINSSALSFIIKGQPPIYTDPYNEYPLVAVKNNNSVWEILRVSAVSYDSNNDETTITILERGYLGITNAQINANAEFHLCYKVYVTRVLRDAPVLDETVYNEQSTGESQIQREFLVEITEV